MRIFKEYFLSIKAKQRYINPSTNQININILKQDAELLPQRHRTWKDFKKSFGSGNHYNIEFKGYKIHIDLSYAFEHFKQNTYSENREEINATLLSTIQNPLIVIKDKYEGKNALIFYKPFVSKNQILHLTIHKAIENEKTGVYTFKTIYEVNGIHKIVNIINALDLKTVYFKFD